MRIVLLILKSFSQSMRRLVDLFLGFLDASFDSGPPANSPKKGQILLQLEDLDDWERNHLPSLEKDPFSVLISGKGFGLRNRGECFQLASFEGILPLIQAIIDLKVPNTEILLMWPSLIPCTFEENYPLFTEVMETKRTRLIKQLIHGVKRLSLEYNFNLIWVDNRAMIGYKNSALLERLFSQSSGSGQSR
jgi:hypothetical protein